MADIELLIKIPESIWVAIQNGEYCGILDDRTYNAIKNGTPLTSDVLADLLMEERIRGEFEHDVSYSKDVIDNVRWRLTLEIIDRRPCYCGAELRAVWRESEDKE